MITREQAETIAEEVRDQAAQPPYPDRGLMVYRLDGSGGQWYTDDHYGFGTGTVSVPVRRSLTADDVAELFAAAEKGIDA